MQITVLGASGKVGRLVVTQALAHGYTVRALVHSHNPFSEHQRVTVVKGDVYQHDDLIQALRGSQAVVSTLGSWGTPKKNVLSSAMQLLPGIMKEQEIKRIVTLTGAEAKLAGEKFSLARRLAHFAAALVAPRILADAEEHLVLLQQSGLDWTTVRSPIMNNWGKLQYSLANRWPWPWQTIHRQAVAVCLVDQVEDETYLEQAPVIYRKT